MMVGHFEGANPTSDQFQQFLLDTEKFYKEANVGNTIDAIIVVTPQKFDRKPFAYLLEHSDKRVVDLIEFKTLAGRKGPEPALSAPASPAAAAPSVVSATPVPSQMLDIATIQAALQSPADKERVLYAWEVFPEKTAGTGQTILVAT